MRVRPFILLVCLGILLPGAAACRREMPHERYVALLTEATDSMRARNARLERAFRLGSYEHWDWDQDAGVLVFSDSGVARVIADVQFVGDVSLNDSTFLWAWANQTVDRRLQRAAANARRYGQRHGIRKLTEAHWAADEVDGWEMTSLTGLINHSAGIYRAPVRDSRGFTFLVMSHLRWAPPNTPVSAIITLGDP
jgi:hypothetical protein